MLELLRSLVQAATPFMQHQASPDHFEFLGLDIIADRAGGVWLMEGETRAGAGAGAGAGALAVVVAAAGGLAALGLENSLGKWRARALDCAPLSQSFVLQDHATGKNKVNLCCRVVDDPPRTAAKRPSGRQVPREYVVFLLGGWAPTGTCCVGKMQRVASKTNVLRRLIRSSLPFVEVRKCKNMLYLHVADNCLFPLLFQLAGLARVVSVPGLPANRLPGLQSSKQNLDEENQVYDGMVQDILRLLVLPALTGRPPEPGKFEVSAHNHPSIYTLPFRSFFVLCSCGQGRRESFVQHVLALTPHDSSSSTLVGE